MAGVVRTLNSSLEQSSTSNKLQDRAARKQIHEISYQAFESITSRYSK